MRAARQGGVVLQFVAALVGELRPLGGGVSGEESAHTDGGDVRRGTLVVCRAGVLKAGFVNRSRIDQPGFYELRGLSGVLIVDALRRQVEAADAGVVGGGAI